MHNVFQNPALALKPSAYFNLKTDCLTEVKIDRIASYSYFYF